MCKFQDYHEEGPDRVPVPQVDSGGPSHPRVHHQIRGRHEAEVTLGTFVNYRKDVHPNHM